MILKIKDRILILSILPKESDILTQRIVKDLKGNLGLNEEDWKEYEIVANPAGGVKWNPDKDKGVEIEIGEKGKAIICDALKLLDTQKKVTEDFISVFDMFLSPDASK